MNKKITLAELPGELRRLERRLKNIGASAMRKTSRDAVGIIKPNTPKAFGDLIESIHAVSGGDGNTEAQTVVDAPHAAAVEEGSLPHYPDFEALLAWVKLRGMQGLTNGGKIRTRYRRSEGPTTPGQAMSVAAEIKAYEVRGTRNVGRHVPIGSAEEVARRIAAVIAKTGTHPHFYVLKSLPKIEEALERNIQSALERGK